MKKLTLTVEIEFDDEPDFNEKTKVLASVVTGLGRQMNEVGMTSDESEVTVERIIIKEGTMEFHACLDNS